MIRLISIILSIVLGLFPASAPAFAAESKNAEIHFDHRVLSLAATDETVYVLTLSDDRIPRKQLYYWADGMQEPSEYINGDAGANQLNLSDHIFSDGTNIYGYAENPRSIAGILPQSNTVITLDTEEADAALDLIFAQNQIIYLLQTVFTESGDVKTLQLCSLETGEKITEVKVDAFDHIIPYKDGKLLATMSAETGDHYDVLVYDPLSDTYEKIAQTETSRDSGFAYSESRNTLYFTSGAQIYAFGDMQSPCHLSAYTPEEVNDWFSCMTLGTDLYAYLDTNGGSLIVRQLDQIDLSRGVLTVMGDIDNSPHEEIMTRNPSFALSMQGGATTDFSQIATSMISGEDAIDIITLDTGYSPIQQIIDKGYAADLSGYPAIMESVSQMDQALLSFLMRDGKLYGVPIQLLDYGMNYDKEVLAELGISQGELPKTYIELLDFIANFASDYGEAHDDIKLFEDFDVKSDLFEIIIEQYTSEMARSGDMLTFDTPLFRKLIAAFEAIDFADIDPYERYGEGIWDESEEMDDFYSKQALFISQHGSYSTPYEFSSSGTYIPIILPLDEGLTPLAPVSLAVMVVSSRTNHMDEAVFYLTERIKSYNPQIEGYALYPNNNAPLVNKNYDSWLSRTETELEDAEKRLLSADAQSKAALEDTIAYLQESLSQKDARKFTISEEQIKAYREKASPYFYVSPRPLLNQDLEDTPYDLSPISNRYLQKVIDADTFIREMDSRVRMMVLEDE
ncbi:MAG: carbohydrate ABC transporter substrate-binding protein [Clostridiales bacterium]|nr:carbohydrate ABC transporter substrate-binding protein [Clostridiales bacterium]